MRGKITKRAVEALESGVRDLFLWDSELPGFGCKVTPKSTRIYLLQYSIQGRDYRVTIGRHGVDVTAEQARLEALRLRGLVAAGENPASTRAIQRTTPTVAELGKRYLEEYATQHKKPSAIAQDRRNLNNHIIPLIGKIRVSAIEREDIARVMRDVAGGKTRKDEKTKHRGRSIVRGGEIVANRTHALLSKMFELAEDWRYRPERSNPCRGAKRYREHKVERFLSTDELARLGAALASAEESSKARYRRKREATALRRWRASRSDAAGRAESLEAIAAIRLLLFTGCRVGEILNLRWSDVDIERRVLFLSDSKTGAKPVYLSQAALDVLLAIERNPDIPYVLPGPLPGKPLPTLRNSWARLCAAARIDGLRLHDLRHSFASIGAADGLSLPMIGALLGHSQTNTTARYAHLAATPLHQAADAIGARLVSAMRSGS